MAEENINRRREEGEEGRKIYEREGSQEQSGEGRGEGVYKLWRIRERGGVKLRMG